LSSHLPTIETGSISIFLTNDQTSLSPNEPLTGKVYVNMNEAFDAKALTLSLIGYQRAVIAPDINKDKKYLDV